MDAGTAGARTTPRIAPKGKEKGRMEKVKEEEEDPTEVLREQTREKAKGKDRKEGVSTAEDPITSRIAHILRERAKADIRGYRRTTWGRRQTLTGPRAQTEGK